MAIPFRSRVFAGKTGDSPPWNVRAAMLKG